MSGEHLDLSSEPSPEEQAEGVRRRFIGIHFTCCGVYSRIHPNAERTAYVGHCPRCTRPIRLEIGPGGSDQRIFTAY